MDTPFFSIITVSFNAEKYIEETVLSTLDQTFTDFEIIIKDGMSKDNTIQKIPSDNRIRIHQSKDSGIYNAMNQAITLANGKYLVFMNCGDVFFDNTVLEKVHDYINNTDPQDRGIVIGDCYSKGLYKCQNGCNKRFKQYRCSGFSHQSMFIQAEQFKKYGLYDESFTVYADMEFFLRITNAGERINYIAYPICNYMGGGFSEQKDNKKRLDDDKRRMRKMYFSLAERMKFWTMFHMTLPKLRSCIERDNTPKCIIKIYRNITNKINNRP